MPRYELGRALPPYAFQPGAGPHPIKDAAGHSFGARSAPARPVGAANWHDHSDWRYAADLYNHGYYWEAHEVWEGLWHLAAKGSAERLLLQGLIQVAGAYLKRAAGQSEGASKLAERGVAKLRRAAPAGERLLGVAVGAFADAVEAGMSAGTAPVLRLEGAA